jgi:hypothetical protein
MSSLAEDSENPLSSAETTARIEVTSDSQRDETGGTARVDPLCKVLGIHPCVIGAYIQSVLKREGVPFVEDVLTGSGSGRWAGLIPDEPKGLLLGKSDDALKIAFAVWDFCRWLLGRTNRKFTIDVKQSLAAELASLPPDSRLDRLLWHAPKKLLDILNDAIAQDQSVLHVLNVHDVDSSVLSRIDILINCGAITSVPHVTLVGLWLIAIVRRDYNTGQTIIAIRET